MRHWQMNVYMWGQNFSNCGIGNDRYLGAENNRRFRVVQAALGQSRSLLTSLELQKSKQDSIVKKAEEGRQKQTNESKSIIRKKEAASIASESRGTSI